MLKTIFFIKSESTVSINFHGIQIDALHQPTNAGTCTSVVGAHMGADKKAEPRRTSSSSSSSCKNVLNIVF